MPAKPTRVLFRAMLLLLVGGLSALPAQKREEDEIQKVDKVDPFTKGEPEAMKALGIERYAPFPWADHHLTSDIDQVLGEGRVLWMETRHFRIGYNMTTAPLPDDSNAKKEVYAQWKRLRKKWKKLPRKPKKLTPWVNLHLYAQRCEEAYAEFEKLVGVTDKTFVAGSKVPGKGPYLGLPDKFLLLCFQKKSDMARYMSRFCNLQVDDSMRYMHEQTQQLLMAVAADGMEDFDAQGLYGHIMYGLWQNFLNGYRGYQYPLPMWVSVGLAHYYSRRVESDFVNVRIADDESVDMETQNMWYRKVLRRAKHDGVLIPFEQLNAMHDWEQFGFHPHTQSWSRMQYLMELDAGKVGLMLDKLKSVPGSGDWEAQGAQLRRMMPKLMFNLFEMEPGEFDENWRAWVLKTYPKRKD